MRKPPTPPLLLNCAQCGALTKKFKSNLRNAEGRVYCNFKCYGLSKVGVKQSPETCAKRSAALSGSNAPTWKGGQSYQFKRGYKSEKYKAWRLAVFTRDNFTCQHCAATGYLTAHHVKAFAKFPELRYEPSNGITLCEDCHAKEDHYYARFKGRKGEVK